MKIGNLRKLLVFGMILSSCISFNVASAANNNDVSANSYDLYSESATDNEISPYAEQIITKFRRYNGMLQYRRWNATKGYWVDPDWIDVP